MSLVHIPQGRRHAPRNPSRGEQGSIMVVVITLIAALLVGAGISVFLQVSDTRSTGLIRAARSSLYCAEAGLAAARPMIGVNYALWPEMLDADPSNDPPWYPITGDIDDPPDGVPDFEVTIRDNDDELPPNPNDLNLDNDLRIFVVSRCTKYPETPREVLELVMYQGGGNSYRNQSGQGAGNSGNAN